MRFPSPQPCWTRSTRPPLQISVPISQKNSKVRFWTSTFSFLTCSQSLFLDFCANVFFDDSLKPPGLHFWCFLVIFGLLFQIFLNVFSLHLKNVKYVSRLMYFMVLGLQKMSKNRYILVIFSCFFATLIFVIFSSILGGLGGSKIEPFPAGMRFQKKRCLKKGSTWSKRGSQGAVL